jgi:hypothetical protein
MVYLEGTQCTKFWRLWKIGNWVKSYDVQISLCLDDYSNCICGAGIWFWSELFLISLVLLVWRMHPLRIIWRFCSVLLNGTFALLEKRMIGKWMSLLPSSRHYTQPLWVEIVQIGFGRSLPRKACSRSSPSTPWPALKVDTSLRRVCGGLRLLRGRFFFCDR